MNYRLSAISGTVTSTGNPSDPALSTPTRLPGTQNSSARSTRLTTLLAAALALAAFSTTRLSAQVPTVLTDKIHQGAGSIDLLKDMSAASLQSYLNSNGGLMLGIDVNEDQSGNESRDALGIAIKQMQLVVTTTAGTFSFGDFVTSTTAMIRELGTATAQQFYTAFGRAGSSQITPALNGSGFAALDDVIKVQNVALQGTLLSARLDVAFVNTQHPHGGANETFFDFSGGFEDFALLDRSSAAAVEAANFGVTSAPSGVTFTDHGATVTPPPSAPGAPAPPLLLLGAMGALVALKGRRAANG